MRRLSKKVVVVGLGAFLLALMSWLPAPAYASQAEDEGVIRKIVKLGSVRFLKVR